MINKNQLCNLGAYDFEKLIQIMLNNQLGLAIQFYGGTKDFGRDAYFKGEAFFPPHRKPWSGKWIFQSKFRDFIRRGENVVRDELIKVVGKELNKIIKKYGNKCDNYIYITNVDFTINDIKKLEEESKNFKISHFQVIHFPQIRAFLGDHDRIRWQFPRLIEFADIESLLNKEVLERSRGHIRNLKDNMETFATTNIFLEALEKINKYNLVILQGPPKMGKSTIAEAISFFKIGNKHQFFYINKPVEFFRCFNQKKKEILVCDDVFGQNQYIPEISNEWVKDLPSILKLIDNNHQLVWTSRSSILMEALEKTKLEEQKAIIEPSSVIVEVGKLTKLEKAHILYNHIRASTFFKKYDEKIIEFLLKLKFEIINHPNYSPESIRELCNMIIPKLSGNISFIDFKNEVIDFIKKPQKSWIKDFYSLSDEEKIFIITLFSIRMNSEIDYFEKRYIQILKELNRDFIGKFNQCTFRLNGTYIKIISSWESTKIIFYHPSIIDIINSLLKEDRSIQELMMTIGGSIFIESLIQNQVLNEEKKKLILKKIIQDDSIEEISDYLAIITKNYPEKIFDKDIKFLLKELSCIEFFNKFKNQTLNFYQFWLFFSNFKNFKVKIVWIKDYIIKLIDAYLPQYDNVTDPIEEFLFILELIFRVYTREFQDVFRGNKSIFLKITEILDDEKEWVESDAIDLMGDFNDNVDRLNQLFRDFEFKYPLIDAQDLEEHYQDFFDEKDNKEFELLQTIKKEERKELDEIIEFLFNDLKDDSS
ncbi:MAG: hypothetical protein KJI71_00165 [Patescibacteria group bacterium]|nr:hypothetical protein [Patescibacteria group bacterium]